MFGPNSDTLTKLITDFSHRDTKFIKLYKNLSDCIIDKFGLDKYKYDVLFIGGSGTLAIESLFWSSKKPIEVIGNDGAWADKWRAFSERYALTYNEPQRDVRSRMLGFNELYCQLETSTGEVYDKPSCLVDGVSSFPYYDIPIDTKVFVTCSNKQLGSLAGLGIVFVRKDFWNELENDSVFSYLNLARYKKYGFIGQTPTTAPVTIFQHLYERMQHFDLDKLRKKIDEHSKILIEIFGGNPSPVFNIPKTEIPTKIAAMYDLYGLNTDSKNYSIFTYTTNTYMYERFYRNMK
jgi:aspartate aminotransferase-like enzyme